MCPDQHIYVPTDICGPGVNFGTSRPAYVFFWLEYTPTCRNIAVLALFGRNKLVPGRFWPFLAGSGRFGPRLGRCSGAAAIPAGSACQQPVWAGAGLSPVWASAQQVHASSGWAGVGWHPGWAGVGRHPGWAGIPPVPTGPTHLPSQLGRLHLGLGWAAASITRPGPVQWKFPAGLAPGILAGPALASWPGQSWLG
jgi:hypothetical protein